MPSVGCSIAAQIFLQRMSLGMREQENLWSALTRRKVVRSLVLYLTAAWLLIQVASLLAGIWSLPAGFVQNLFLLLVLGLPPVAVLSWIYELREETPGEAAPVGFAELLRRELQSRPLRALGAALGITVAMLLAVAYVWPDEEPSADARALVRFAPRLTEDPQNFYYGLFGLHAPEAEDIWDYGRLVATRRMVFGASLPEGLGSGFTIDLESLCDLRERGCEQKLSQAVEGATRLLEANALPLARYRQIRDARTFGYPIEISSIDEPLPTQSGLALASRLEVLAALRQDADGDHAGAIARIGEDLRFHRLMLARSNLMLGKMVAIRSVQNDVRALALLSERAAQRPDRAGFPALPPARLGTAERSVIEVAGAETRWMMRVMLGDEDRAETAAALFLEGPWQRTGFRLLPLRRNATLNRMAAEFMQMARHGELDARAFAALPAPKARDPSAIEYFNNGAGLLLPDYTPDFRAYVERLHDLDSLIVLARVAHRLHSDGVDAQSLPAALLALPAELRDPFTGAPPEWIDGELRFPREDGKERRVEPWLPFSPAPDVRVDS